MRKVRMISSLVLTAGTAVFLLGRFVVPFPDWLVRTDGILMLASVFAAVFSTVAIKKK